MIECLGDNGIVTSMPSSDKEVSWVRYLSLGTVGSNHVTGLSDVMKLGKSVQNTVIDIRLSAGIASLNAPGTKYCMGDSIALRRVSILGRELAPDCTTSSSCDVGDGVESSKLCSCCKATSNFDFHSPS